MRGDNGNLGCGRDGSLGRRLGGSLDDAHVARFGGVGSGLLVKVGEGKLAGAGDGGKASRDLLLVTAGAGAHGADRTAGDTHGKGAAGHAEGKGALGAGKHEVRGFLQREGVGRLRRSQRHHTHQSGKDGRIPLHLHA